MTGRALSLIPSLIHVRVSVSSTGYNQALSRPRDWHGQSWTVIPNPEKPYGPGGGVARARDLPVSERLEALRRNRECTVLAVGHVSKYGNRGAHTPPGSRGHPARLVNCPGHGRCRRSASRGVWWRLTLPCGRLQLSWLGGACRRVLRARRGGGARRAAVCHRGQPLARTVVGTPHGLGGCARSGRRYGSRRSRRQSAG